MNNKQLQYIFSMRDKMSAGVEKINKKMEKQNSIIQKNNTRMAKARHMAVAAGKGLKVLGGASVALSAGFGVAIMKVAKMGDDLDKTSQKVGMSVEELQKLRYAADLSGVSSQVLTKGLTTLQVNVGSLTAKTGSLYTYLNKTDKGFLNTLSHTKDNAEAFKLLMQRIDKTNDPMKRAALAQAAFGGAAKKMIPLLNAGSSGIQKMGKEAEVLGIMSTKQAKDSAAFIDSLTRLKGAFTGLLYSLTSVLGTLTKWINTFVSFIASVRKAHPEIKTLVTHLSAIAATGMMVGLALGFVMKAFSPLATVLKVVFSLAKAIKIVRVFVIAWSAATKIFTAIQAAFNLVLMANPIGLVVAAISLLVVGLGYLTYKIMKSKEGFTGFFRTIKQWVSTNMFQPFINSVKAVYIAVKTYFSAVFAVFKNIYLVLTGKESMLEGIHKIKQAFVDFIDNTFVKGIQKIKNVWGSVKGFFGFGKGSSKIEAVKKVVHKVKKVTSGTIKHIVPPMVTLPTLAPAAPMDVQAQHNKAYAADRTVTHIHLGGEILVTATEGTQARVIKTTTAGATGDKPFLRVR